MITFITGNKHKVIEAESIFKNYDIKLEHIDLGYMEPQGTLEALMIDMPNSGQLLGFVPPILSPRSF